MSMDNSKPGEPATGRLVDAVRKVRIASADKSDVVVEMRDATLTRLELLAQDLQPVIDEVPEDDDRFDFALSSGLQPRFWIDATAHVAMAPDRRTYRFVRDTRLGRIVLAESADRAAIVDAVIDHVAMRIHERELVLAGETVSYRGLRTGRESPAKAADAELPPDEQVSRIERAVEALHKDEDGSTETVHGSAAQQDGTHAASAIRPRRRGIARTIAGGLAWILFGAAAGGAIVLYLYRQFPFQP
ncbi:hypothetical protein [Oricola thermophila]|uniref:Uncharacterized protein n=1 Tax=Oricola thermophila TaxID=2742145 RepID=A0A6N1VD63_9HYPH|nr:hypothetical protein [Oricola thermophila]QKV17079.1 hypothetical protein HTY61_00660 [Oricola thermophila]